MSGIHEIAGIIHRRWDCLDAIVDAPGPKGELVDRLDTPRSTLDDIVRELEGAGLVAYEGGKWRATTVGHYAHDSYGRFLGSLDDVQAVGDILAPLSDAESIAPAMLNGAVPYEATDPVPDAVVQQFITRIGDADRIRGFAPRAVSGYADMVPERAAETDTTVELVMTEDIYEQLTALYPPDDRPAAQRESLRVFHGPIPYEYGLWIGDDSHAGLVVYTDQGINGLIINESDAAVEWATEQYEQVRERATPVDEGMAPNTDR
jgi:predicted transcriptional regulator